MSLSSFKPIHIHETLGHVTVRSARFPHGFLTVYRTHYLAAAAAAGMSRMSAKRGAIWSSFSPRFSNSKMYSQNAQNVFTTTWGNREELI